MTIIEAAITILAKNNVSLTAKEIYKEICINELYIFRAKKPISVLQAELKRHSYDYIGKNRPVTARLKHHSDNTYSLL